MEIWIAFLLFVMNIGDDYLAVRYFKAVADSRYWQAGFFSTCLALTVIFGVTQYVENKVYAIPIALGSGVGAVYGTWRAKKKREAERVRPTMLRCDVCGRFISYKDFDDGKALRWMVTPDSEYSREEWETRCSRHLPENRRVDVSRE